MLNDVKISKLSTFSVESLKVKLVGMRLKISFDFEVPVLEFEAGLHFFLIFTYKILNILVTGVESFLV